MFSSQGKSGLTFAPGIATDGFCIEGTHGFGRRKKMLKAEG